MNNDEKELRKQKVIDLHNSDTPIPEIMKATGLSRSGIYKILDSVLKKGEIAPKEATVQIKLTGQEERFTSFVGYERTNKNEYVHKDTGEIVNVVFVKATDPGKFGYFVKVKGGEKKSTASGNDNLEPADAKL